MFSTCVSSLARASTRGSRTATIQIAKRTMVAPKVRYCIFSSTSQSSTLCLFGTQVIAIYFEPSSRWLQVWLTCIFCIWFGFVAVSLTPPRSSFLYISSYLQQLGEAQRSAEYAWNKSCYSGIDYTIGDDSPVLDAVEKFAAYNVGCLVTTDTTGMFILLFE